MNPARYLELVNRCAKDQREALEARDDHIRSAAANGATLRAIASAAQMSVEGVRKIINREER